MSPEELQAAKAHPNAWPYLIALLCNFCWRMPLRAAERFGVAYLFRGISVGILVGMAVAVAMVTEMVFELRPTLVHCDRRWLSSGGLHSDGHHYRRVEAKGQSELGRESIGFMKIEGRIVQGYLKALTGLDQLPGPDGERSIELFRHGTLTVKLYAPRGTDGQNPHTRDEIYVIATGNGRFLRGGRSHLRSGRRSVRPRREEHRFVDFSDDFATWVFFYGPEGGEAQPLGLGSRFAGLDKCTVMRNRDAAGGWHGLCCRSFSRVQQLHRVFITIFGMTCLRRGWG